MTISDSMSNFGSFSLKLRTKVARDDKNRLLPAAPQELLDLFAVTDGPDAFLGHVIVTPQAFTDKDEVDVLSQSRYTGVLRESKFSSEDVEISGSGLIYWLGDLQERGPIFDTELNLVNESFADGISQILPPAITEGTIIAEVGTQSASYLFVTARAALEDWLSLFGAEYYVDPQGRLNAGTPASLFPTYNNPTTFVVRKGAGDDEELKPLPLASLVLSGDMTNFATKVISLVQVEDTNFIEGSAEGSTSKRDLHGNLVEITDINNESSTLAENVDARAAARLAQISIPRQSVELSTEDYDIHGDFKPGDSIWVYDQPSGAYDLTNKIEFNGQIYFPIKLRVLEITYPVVEGMGVYFRAPDLNGTLYDLTPYVAWEPPGTSQIEVSAFTRSLIPPSSGGIGGVIAPVLNPDTDPPPVANAPTAVGNVLNVQVIWDVGTGGVPYSMPHDIAGADVHISTSSGFTPDATNLVGYLTATKSNVEGTSDSIKTFEVPSADTRYVRVVPFDLAGNRGPASPQVAVAAGLIDTAHITDLAVTNAKINDLSVAKLTAGDISAAIITLTASGMFRFGRTSFPFHHGKIDANGIHTFVDGSAAYTGGTEQFDLDVAAGTVTMTGGLLQTAESGQRVVMTGISGSGADIHAFNAFAEEGEPALMTALQAGSGGTRFLSTGYASAWYSNADYVPRIGMRSQSNDKTIGGQIQASVNLSYWLMKNDLIDIFASTGGRIFLDAEVDLVASAGGRILIDGATNLIAGGFTRAIVDDIPGGGTGDSPLRLVIQGIGTRRIIADVTDSGGAGFRRLVVAN